jgi:acyl carrier protein phosphodiesterase
MNFLAHIYLSGSSDEIIVGNFIGDYVKGRKYNDYPDKIKEGILLHRHIDHFTDKNPIVRKTKGHFQENYGKYAGVVVDILYDHFLANNWRLYCNISLDKFIGDIFETLESFFDVFPQKVKSFFPSFVNNNWLGKNITLNGIEGVLRGMSRRTSLPNETGNAMKTITGNYKEMEKEFNCYFPELIDFVETTHNISLNSNFNNGRFLSIDITPVAS